MVSSLGLKLASYALITGFGYHHKKRVTNRGRGMTRDVLATAIRTVAPLLINKIASAVQGSGIRHHRLFGSSFKLSGGKRAPRRVGWGIRKTPVKRAPKRTVHHHVGLSVYKPRRNVHRHTGFGVVHRQSRRIVSRGHRPVRRFIF